WNQHAPVNHFLPAVITRRNYGWAKAVEQRACTNKDEVSAYYRRYGSLVALAHIMGAIDLHKENLVAAGEYPVIVDSETLFSCILDDQKSSTRNFHLYSSLLLPAHQMRDAIEISPITAQSGKKLDIDILVNPQRKESNIRFESHKLVTGQCSCEVRLGETLITDFSPYDESLIDGMHQTFSFILENREVIFEILKHCMHNAIIRFLYRATQNYTTVLHNSWHPDTLIRGEVKREFLVLANSSLN
ncbi:DUF4135 domain-containing protein, partial [Bacillus anthracis]|uniref:DUF4135 domain-containing protein n=1 Tax=Bacillus anthracis TaxID=1392 RepID=UPI0039A46C76